MIALRQSISIFFFCCSVVLVNAQSIKYSYGKNSWNADSLGNHRAVLNFNGTGAVAKSIIEWRRRDDDPSKKRIIIQDAVTGAKINNYKTGEFNNERLEVWFEPKSGKGTYYIYYWPYKNEGRANYPKGVALAPENSASSEWIKQAGLQQQINTRVEEIQSIDSLNSFYPMEIIATEKEMQNLMLTAKGKDYLVFPEDRAYPIKMQDRIPQRWIQKKPSTVFEGAALRGEFYAFQLGVFAMKDIEDLHISFTDLKSSGVYSIPVKRITCINTSGVTYDGKPFAPKVNIAKNQVQPLWCIIEVPADARPGTYTGTATISADNAQKSAIKLSLNVQNGIVKDGGINEPWKQTRLTWLNSTLAQNNDVIAPYIPIKRNENRLEFLGRAVELNDDGLPKMIQTYFTEEMTDTQTSPNNIITEPVHFHFYDKNNKNIPLKKNKLAFTQQQPGTYSWKNDSYNDSMKLEVTGMLEFDGFMSYKIKLTANKDIQLNNINLHFPFTDEASKYMMGLGLKGQQRPDSVSWKWDVANKNQDGAWIGGVNAGLQYSLRDEHYTRPLNTNFYLQKPLILPKSWGNNGKGGINVWKKGSSVLADNYTGEIVMKKGDSLHFDFTLLITPFHTINTDFQWATRFYHKYDNIEKIKNTGATVVNIHHANPINPWINYPFIEHKKMKNYIDSAHAAGLKVKIYNTVRELSNHAYETFALRSLGHEIYSPGQGGGFSWLQEHLGKDYIAAWFVPEIKDAAIVNSGMSRWHSYYVEGMNWLTQNVGIDGIYLDDVAFDRVTMKRIKRVLTKDGYPGIIDLHSANQFNKSDGYINSANLYMEHFPYLNRLWFGEYFDYEKNNADFFLTEISGIPFGLMGEMLQDGGNPWRGMVYGMTNRMPWSQNADPRPIWNVWNEFGMTGSKMVGYWVSNNPVKTGVDEIKATVFKKQGKTLIALASWASDNKEIMLDIDFKSLGINPAKATLKAPDVKNFQTGRIFKINEKIPVEKGKGWLLIIE